MRASRDAGPHCTHPMGFCMASEVSGVACSLAVQHWCCKDIVKGAGR